MSQYYPSAIILHNEKFSKKSFLHRRITLEEFEEVHEHALSLGFRNMLVQFPQDFKLRKDIDDFVPDFERKKPFKGNR